MFELTIAIRYLKAKRKQTVISIITVISVIGVVAGVMALVIALAINNGFRDTLERNLLSATAEVSIQERVPSGGIDQWEQISSKLAHLPHVLSAAPGLYEPALMTGASSEGVEVKGIRITSGAPIPPSLQHLKTGSFEGLRPVAGKAPGIILGSKLAEQIGAGVGKSGIKVLVPDCRVTPTGVEPCLQPVRVVGTFESGFFDVDAHWAFMSLGDTQTVFGLDDVVNDIELTLDDIEKAPEVAAAADAIIGPKLTALSWEDMNSPLLHAFKMERIVTIGTIGLIQLVGALNILIALIMIVMEKHRDIAILMSMGTRVQQIRRIFMLEGALIGAAGTSIGLIVGYTLCYFADRYQWVQLDAQIYGLSYVPFEAHWIDGLWIAATAMAVSLLATLYPARNATRIAPVEALRYE
ncbi:MAG TPA: FtsX-like permease family protein [Bryobacteraceae bacterium]|jgi:lipoprotein-releasing system permease protein